MTKVTSNIIHSRFVDTGEMRESFPFRQRALYAFEEVDGVDVCFFGLHVQESELEDG